MRPAISQSARQVLRATTREAPRQHSSRAPYVCASCRSASSHQAFRQPVQLPHQKAFSTTRLQQQDSTSNASIRKETVLPQTYYDLFPSTFPEGPPPASPFTPDLRALRKEFLQLQAKAHPDLASADKKRQAEALSARINEAYKTLQDPLSRARYLLSQRGIDVEDESAQITDNGLLMEVMEAREAVEEVEEEEELVGIREENGTRIKASVGVLEDCFAKQDMERAAQEAIRLRYWMNIEESIQGWEKGKGGGIIHH